jgi:hypothetical protein
MSFPARLWTIGLAGIAFSIYIGLEIDYRHWTWIVFLVIIPAVIGVVLIVTARSRARASTSPQREDARPGQ